MARSLRRPSLAPGLIATIALLLDVLALGLGLWFAGFASAGAAFDPVRAALLAAAGAVPSALVLWACGGYRLGALRRFSRGTAMLLALGLLVALGRGVDPGASLAIVAFVLPARALGAALATAAVDFGLTERRAVIIGGGERGARVMAALAASPEADIRVCGIFDDRDDSRSPPVVSGVPKLGTLDALVTFARTAEIDMLIVTLPLGAERRIREVLKAVEVLPVDVRLSDFSSDPGFGAAAAPPGMAG